MEYGKQIVEPRNYTGSYNGSGGGSAYDNPKIEVGSVVRDDITANEQTLTEIHDAISRFEQRLETVLTPMPPADPSRASGTTVGPPCSHLANRLRTLNDTGRQALQRLEELTRRVEV